MHPKRTLYSALYSTSVLGELEFLHNGSLEKLRILRTTKMTFLYRCFKLQQIKVLRFKMATLFPEFDLLFTVRHLHLRRGQDSRVGHWHLYKDCIDFFFSTCENLQCPLPPNLACRRVELFCATLPSQSSLFSRPGWKILSCPEESCPVIRLDLEEIKRARLFQYCSARILSGPGLPQWPCRLAAAHGCARH